jgi:hypothetical protein
MVSRTFATVSRTTTTAKTRITIMVANVSRKTNSPGPNWAYSTQNLTVIRGYSLGSKENPLATNFVCKGELATSPIRCASSATS